MKNDFKKSFARAPINHNLQSTKTHNFVIELKFPIKSITKKNI